MVTKKRAADLTKDMLESGDWRNVEFKPYNFNTLGLPTGGGYFHPLLKARVGWLSCCWQPPLLTQTLILTFLILIHILQGPGSVQTSTHGYGV